MVPALAPAVVASSPSADATRIGRVAYVTAHNQVEVAAVSFTGVTTHITRLGPVTKPPRHRSVTISRFVGSGDGHWLAWDETLTKPGGALTSKTVLVVRELRPDHVYRLRTRSYPVGFAGDQLVTGGAHTNQFVPSPSPHLVRVVDDVPPIGVYPQGTVTVQSFGAPPGPGRTREVDLDDFGGSATTLDHYVLSAHEPGPVHAFTSGDGTQLVVERGAAGPFNGPSSVLDGYDLTGSPPVRVPLGHLGSIGAGWRLGGLTFAGPSDAPWAVWQRAGKGGADSVVAVLHHSGWDRVVPHGIAVAANPAGYVIAQPGRFVFHHSRRHFMRVPIGEALLLHGTTTKVLGIEGSALLWVA
jgi:hypothetical protein